MTSRDRGVLLSDRLSERRKRLKPDVDDAVEALMKGRWLSWRQVADLDDDFTHVAAHSRTHPRRPSRPGCSRTTGVGPQTRSTSRRLGGNSRRGSSASTCTCNDAGTSTQGFGSPPADDSGGKGKGRKGRGRGDVVPENGWRRRRDVRWYDRTTTDNVSPLALTMLS